MIFFFIVEHAFFLAKSLEENKLQVKNCTPKSTDFWQNYLWRTRPHLIYNFPYSPIELPLYEVGQNIYFSFYYFSFYPQQWINLLQAIAWSFSDILILMLAIGVKFRFNQFNLRFKIISRDEHLMTDLNFRKMRIHFFKLIDLVYFLDSHISSLVFISLGHNMLVIMVKVFSVLK